MSTAYSNIFERFAIGVEDYDLDALYSSSVDSYEVYLTGLLRKAIVKFSRCSTDISKTARDDTARVFTNTLTDYEEEVLANLMLIEWFTKEINRVEDMRMGLNSTDFKRYSEAQNLTAKTNRLKQLRIDVDGLIVDYTYDTADLTDLG